MTLLEIQIQLGQRLQAFGDVFTHQALRIPGAAVEDGIGDLAMTGVGVVDATRAVEGRDQQSIDRNAQALEEHADKTVARALDDQLVPLIVEPSEAFMVDGVLDAYRSALTPRFLPAQ